MVKPSLKIKHTAPRDRGYRPPPLFQSKKLKGPTMSFKISREKTISEILIFYDDDRIEDESVDFL